MRALSISELVHVVGGTEATHCDNTTGVTWLGCEVGYYAYKLLWKPAAMTK